MWVPEPGTEGDATGFDLSRIEPLVATLANLNTPRFLQYHGEISSTTGLAMPRLSIEVHTGDTRGLRVLRLGRSNADQTLATTARADSGSFSGPVFLLPGPAWHDLIQSSIRGMTLPDDSVDSVDDLHRFDSPVEEREERALVPLVRRVLAGAEGDVGRSP